MVQYLAVLPKDSVHSFIIIGQPGVKLSYNLEYWIQIPLKQVIRSELRH